MNKKGASAARSEVRDTLTYFEAATVTATASNSSISNRNRKWDTDTSSAGSGTSSSRGGGRSSRVISRHASSNSLLRPRLGLDPNALFSVAAIATAPAGTTVIENDESSVTEAERSEVEAEWMEMKASVTRFFVINMNQNDRHGFIFTQ